MLGLRFADPELEARFRAEEYDSVISRLRASLAVGAVLYALFGVLDYGLAGDAYATVSLIRFGLVVPVLLAAFALSYHAPAMRFHEVWVTLAGLTAAAGILAMTVVMGEQTAALYYAGLILTIFFFYAFFRLRLTVTSLMGWLVFLLYWAVSSRLGIVRGEVLYSNLCFLAATNLMGAWVAIMMERGARGAFMDRRTIAQQAGRLRALLQNADRRRAHAERIARVDPLTGLHNRRHFFELAGYEQRRNQRFLSQASVVLVDIDGFKAVNDRFGHQAGDNALRHIADCMRVNLRASDTPSRLGGDEFVVLCPDTPQSAAAAMAERLRGCVALSTHSLAEGPLTISAGVAAFIGEDETLEQVLARADAALYEAKRGGRNQVVQARTPDTARGSRPRHHA